MNRKSAFSKTATAGLLSLALSAVSHTVSAAAEPVTDCPLRDAPFSLESPLIDLLLSEKASAALKSTMPALQRFPDNMIRTEVPSFAAILNAKSLAGMTQTPPEALQALEQQLANLEITDADRAARCARYDNEVPVFDLPEAEINVLVFTKINGFDHGPSVGAATDAIKALAQEQGWAVAVTDKGGAINPETLARFDILVWNNNSGDLLTLSQREAFRNYLENGGGWVGIHGAGGDPSYFWDWYADDLLGARFTGHPMNPQFQEARVDVEANATSIGESLMPGWKMEEEWYSFHQSARNSGATVIATLDESTYTPEGNGQDLRMGEDHPIVWARCVGEGRAFYSAIGHRPEVYQSDKNLTLLGEGLRWAADDSTRCSNTKKSSGHDEPVENQGQ